MNCRRCEHYEACVFWVGMGVEKAFPNKCKLFRDKFRMVELPCRIGDTVYYISGTIKNVIKEAVVEEIYYNGDGFAFRIYTKQSQVRIDVQQEELYFSKNDAKNAVKEAEK